MESEKVVSIKANNSEPDGKALLLREQLAAQALAVIRAHWSRPGLEEIHEILRCMNAQAENLC